MQILKQMVDVMHRDKITSHTSPLKLAYQDIILGDLLSDICHNDEAAVVFLSAARYLQELNLEDLALHYLNRALTLKPSHILHTAIAGEALLLELNALSVC
jgi:hypothetical protein